VGLGDQRRSGSGDQEIRVRSLFCNSQFAPFANQFTIRRGQVCFSLVHGGSVKLSRASPNHGRRPNHSVNPTATKRAAGYAGVVSPPCWSFQGRWHDSVPGSAGADDRVRGAGGLRDSRPGHHDGTPNCPRTVEGSAHMTCARRDGAPRLATSAPRRGATAARADEGSRTGPRAVRRTPSRPS
jgi:hypothetical protein